MGVESNYFIMPASSAFRPDVDAIESLIRTLHEKRYLGVSLKWSVGTSKSSGCIDDLRAVLERNHSTDIRLWWQTSDLAASGLIYPLSKTPGPEGVYYDIEIHLVGDTAYRTSEVIQPFDSVQCVCGRAIEELPYPISEPFAAGRLPSRCSACGNPVDYSQIPMVTCDPMTGAPKPGHGGITYRSAIVVDCGKYFPDYGTSVEQGFISAIEAVLGGGLRVIQDFH
jgi:hypothetical protein